MEKYTIDKDIPCYTIEAAFPNGVLAAHQQLHAAFAGSSERRYFGISRGTPGGGVAYKAAAEKLSGDSPHNEFGDFIIPQGRYKGTEIKNFRKDVTAIGKLFSTLLQDPELDPHGFCLEWYSNENDVRCMVKLLDK